MVLEGILWYNTQLFTEATKIRPVSGDLLMVDASLLDAGAYDAIDKFARSGIHVFVWSNNILDVRWLDRLKACPESVHCYGELEPDVMEGSKLMGSLTTPLQTPLTRKNTLS